LLDLHHRRLGFGNGGEVVGQLQLGAPDQTQVGGQSLARLQLVELCLGGIELHLLVPRLLVLEVEIRDVAGGMLAPRELGRGLLRLQQRLLPREDLAGGQQSK
jgi:hypothetical protein